MEIIRYPSSEASISFDGAHSAESEASSCHLDDQVFQAAKHVLLPQSKASSALCEMGDREQLATLQADISVQELNEIRAFASKQSQRLRRPKRFSKKTLATLSRGISHAVTVYPNGEFVAHLGRKEDKLFDPERRGSWKTLTRGVKVSKSHIKAMAVLQIKTNGTSFATVDAILNEDRRAAKYHSNYVIEQSEAVIVIPKANSQKIYLFQPLSDMNGFQLLKQNVPVREKLRMVRDAARGVQAIHDHGDVHGDVKLSNMLADLTPDKKEVKRARLADLGMCRTTKELEEAWKAGRPIISGTKGYIPWAVAVGVRPRGPGDDVYALGVIVNALLQECDAQLNEKQKADLLALQAKASDPFGVDLLTAQQFADVIDGLL